MDFENAVFKLMPTPGLLLKPNGSHFTIVNANNAYLHLTGTNESDLLGKNLFSVFPRNSENPKTKRVMIKTRDSLLSVLHSGEAHRLRAQKYEMPVKGSSAFEIKFLETENIPIPDQEGKIRLIIHSLKDVTEKVMASSEKSELENKYNELFQLSPLPMWAYDIETLKFIYVNAAAIKHYGYSKKEFLAMSIREIRPPEDVATLENVSRLYSDCTKMYFPGIFRHLKKNGDLIKVDIYSSLISLRGKKLKLIAANDITERLNYINTVEKQNKLLHEITWIQSHLVRAPLARIMGCANLLAGTTQNAGNHKLLNYLLESAKEFDGIIKEIVTKACQAKPFTPAEEKGLNRTGAAYAQLSRAASQAA